MWVKIDENTESANGSLAANVTGGRSLSPFPFTLIFPCGIVAKPLKDTIYHANRTVGSGEDFVIFGQSKEDKNIKEGEIKIQSYSAAEIAAEIHLHDTGDITIRNKSGLEISIHGENLTIKGNAVKIEAASVDIADNVTIDGKPFLSHTHGLGGVQSGNVPPNSPAVFLPNTNTLGVS